MATPKRANVPSDPFETEGGALDKLLRPSTAPLAPTRHEAAPPPPAPDVQLDVEELARTSFYLYPRQLEKLDDLATEYRKKTGKRINRQDIMRWLVNAADMEAVLRGVD